MTHFCAVVDDEGRADISAVVNGGILGNPHTFCRIVEFIGGQRRAKLEDELFDMRERFPGVFETLKQRRCNGVR